MRPPLLNRLALNLLVLPYDAFAYAADLIDRLLRRHERIFREGPGAAAVESPITRVAVVAAYPTPLSLPFLVNLLNGLRENGFFVLAVLVRKLPDDIYETIRARSHYCIEKNMAGRDFGSYKTGWEWLKKNNHVQNLTELAFINDSLYWPRYIGQTIRELREQKADWLCLFENFQTLYHAQSFFQIFRKPIIGAAFFDRFWAKYPCPSARMRVITKGEVGLTRALTKAGFDPHAAYNSVRLRADVLKVLEKKDVPLIFDDVLNITLGYESRKRTGKPPVKRDDFLALLPAAVAHKVAMLAEHQNPTHATGLLCNYLYQAPLKRDICYRDVLAMSDLVTLAQGFSSEEKEAMLLDLRHKGAPAQFDGIRKIPQRLLWTAGRI